MSDQRFSSGLHLREHYIQAVRWPFAAVCVVMAVAPFLFAQIPPLTDAPGHIGGFSVQLAAAPSPTLQYFSFHWRLVPSLSTAVLMQGLGPAFGLMHASWLICASIAPMTVCAAFAIARSFNPKGAHALPWALLFIYDYPLLKGFLDYSLTLSLVLLSLALWQRLSATASLRGAIFAIMPPLLLIAHGVAGTLLLAMIGGCELGLAWTASPIAITRRLFWTLWPLLTSVAMLLTWMDVSAAGSGVTRWMWSRKLDAWPLMLRDQSIILDVGSALIVLGVLIAGRVRGARFSPAAIGILSAVLVLFLLTPSKLAGSDRLDTRLAPLSAMLALLVQDWSKVAPRVRSMMMLSGSALLVVRLVVTTVSFASYDHRYARELEALDHMRAGARVLNLTALACGAGAWRDDRLEHVSNLATPLKAMWVNSQWAVPSVHLLSVTYHPSLEFDRDPSQYIWPDACAGDGENKIRDRRTLRQTLPIIPYDGIDYLWLIGTRLPAGVHVHRLKKIWATGDSELFAVSRRTPPALIVKANARCCQSNGAGPLGAELHPL